MATSPDTGNDIFGPGGDHSPLWQLFDLLEGGVGAWEPRYRYVNAVNPA
jgi:hypothetical protein